MANKCVCGCGSAPDPGGGAYSAPPDPVAGLRGPISKGRGREGGNGEGRERGGDGEGKDGGGMLHLCRGIKVSGATCPVQEVAIWGVRRRGF